MFDFVSLPYRILAAAGLAVIVWLAGLVHGLNVGQHRVDELVAKQTTEAVRVAKVRDKATQKVLIRYLPAKAKQEVITETIIKEVDRYVPSTAPVLSGGFRVFHDAAAEGVPLPGTPAGIDAPAVTAKEVAGTVAKNYGDCRADQLRLEELQNWIREQQKVK
jgi:hypothetical protein